MAIVIRHATLSEKTQSAISGIISKNEWNALHTLVEPILEGDIQFSPTGHNHNGSNSNVAARVVAVQDSLSLSFYRVASSKPTINEIPILASDGYLNIKRSGVLQYAGIRIYDTNGTTIRGYFRHDFTNAKVNIYNPTGLNYIDLADSGDIGITPRTGWSVIVASDNLAIRTGTVAQPAPAGHNSQLAFNNSAGTPKGYVIYKHCTSTDYDGVWLYNAAGNYALCSTAGNVTLQTVGVNGKAYYAKAGATTPPAAGREIAVRDDISGLGLPTAIGALQYHVYSGTSPLGVAWNNGWVTIPHVGFIYGFVAGIGPGWNGAGSTIIIQQYNGAGAGWKTLPAIWGAGSDGSTYENISNSVVESNMSVASSSSWPVHWMTIPGLLMSNGSNIRIYLSVVHPGNTYWQYGYNLLTWS